MLSPGYSYDKAPDQQHFTGREHSTSMFRKILSNRDPRWRFNMSPLFLEFLMGRRHLECTPWGMPAYSIFGWQKPCYLLQEGYADSFQELLDSTDWRKYGYESGNPKCANCMMHSGYEASAVHYTFSLRGVFATVRAMLDSRYRDAEALRQVETENRAAPLVQIAGAMAAPAKPPLQGTEIAGGAEDGRRDRRGLRLSRRYHDRAQDRRTARRLHLRSRCPRREASHDGQAGRQAGRQVLRDRAPQLSPAATWPTGGVGKPGSGSTPSVRQRAKAISNSCPKRSISVPVAVATAARSQESAEFVRSVVIDAPVETVFAFHEREDALARLSPSIPACACDPQNGRYRGWIASGAPHRPISVGARAHRLREEPALRRRADTRAFRRWIHRHEFEDLGGRTRLTDRVEYRLRGGTVVEAIFGWVVKLGLGAGCSRDGTRQPRGFVRGRGWLVKLGLLGMFRARHATTVPLCAEQ